MFPTTFTIPTPKVKAKKIKTYDPIEDHIARQMGKTQALRRKSERAKKAQFQMADDITSNVSDGIVRGEIESSISSIFSQFSRPIVVFSLTRALEDMPDSAWKESRMQQIAGHLQAGFGDFTNLLNTIWQGTKDMCDTEKIKEFLIMIWDQIKAFISAVPGYALQGVTFVKDVLLLLLNPKFYKTLMVVVLFIVLRYIGLTNVATLLVGIYLTMQDDSYSKIAGCLAMTLGFTRAKLDFDNMMFGPRSRVQHSGTIQLQMDEMHASPASTLASLALMICSTVFAFKVNDYLPADYDAFAKRMNAHAQVARGFSTINDSFSFVINGIKEAAYSFLGIDPDLNGCIPVDLKENADLLMSFDGEKKARMHASPDLVKQAVKGYDDYLKMRIAYHSNRSLSRLIDRMQIGWVNLNTLAQAFNRDPAGMRVVPSVVMLRGESGVGKSSLLNHLAAYVLAEAGKITEDTTDEEIARAIDECIYVRAAETTYWEGYMHQAVTLVDDAFQVRDSVANANLDVMELIRMSNPFPMPLNMAELGAKGNTNFDSPVIVYTTNVKRLRFESVISDEAVQNRVTFPYEVKIKAAFANERGKLRDEFKTGEIRTDVYSFHRWNTNTGAIEVEGISFEDIVSLLIAHMRKNKNRAAARTANLVTHSRAAMDFVRNFDQAPEIPAPVFGPVPLDDNFGPGERPYRRVFQPVYPLRGRGRGLLPRFQMEDEARRELLRSRREHLGLADARNYDDFDEWYDPGDEFEPRTGWRTWLPSFLFRRLENNEQSSTIYAREAAFYCARGFPPPIYSHYIEFAKVQPDWNEEWDYQQYWALFDYHAEQLAAPIHKRISKEMKTLDDIRDIIAERCERYSETLANAALILVAIGIVAGGYSLMTMLTNNKGNDFWWRRIKVEDDYEQADLIREDIKLADRDYEELGYVYGPRYRRFIEYLEWCRDHQRAVIEGDIDVTNYSIESKELDIPQDSLFITGKHESGKDRKFTGRRRLEDCEYETGKDRKFVSRRQFEDGKFETGKDRKHAGRRLEDNASPQKEVNLQGWACNNARDVSMKIRNNIVRLVPIINGEEHPVWIAAVFICNRDLLMNRHYLVRFAAYAKTYDKVEISVRSINSATGVTYSYEEFTRNIVDYEVEDGVQTDLVVNRLDITTGNRYASLLSHIMNASQLESLLGRRAVLLTGSRTGWEQSFGDVLSVEQLTIDVPTDDGKMVRTEFPSTIHVDISSKSGDCGGVYLLDDPHVQKKIVGLHFAGYVAKACAVPLIRERLDKIVDQTVQFGMEYEYSETPEMLIGNCVMKGKTDKGLTVPSKSNLVQTRIFDKVYESDMLPAKLSYSEKPDGILAKALSKQFNEQPVIDEKILNKSVECYSRLLAQKANKRNMRTLTYEEAVCGIPEDPYIRGVERGTSAGWPYCIDARKGKSEWFGKDGPYDLTTPKSMELKEKIEQDIAHMREGNFVRYTFMNVLKDETRPRAKVEAGKTRVFSACPIDFLVVFRMYFMSFLALMMENRIENESAVGIRAQSMEWTQLAKKLKSVGNRMIAGDFSNYDGTLHSRILWKVYDIIEDYYKISPFYSEDDAKVRKVLWENIVSSESIVNNYIYQLNHSQPSGNPSTAILNSMYNSIACRYVYYAAGHENFNKNVRMIAYGDDNLLSVSSEINWNQQSMTDEFAKIGMTYTDENKVGAVDFRPLEEVEFLKRGFSQPFLGAQFAPLKLSSILECFNWIHKTHDERGVMEQNWEMANLELSFHPDDVFEYWTTKIRTAVAQEYGIRLVRTERLRYLAAIRDNDSSVFAHAQWV